MIRAGWADLLVLLALPAAALVAMAAGQPFIVTLATKCAILALAGVGLNLCLGLGGMVSFGHAAFFGIGGYVTGILASHGMSGAPLWGFAASQEMLTIWPAAMLAAGLAALIIGALSLRTTGVYFIMVTLAFAQMVYYLAISWPAYGGEDGLSFYVRNGFAGRPTMVPETFFWIAFGALAAGLALVAAIAQSRFGLALQAVRQNAARVVAVGIAPFPLRLTAFVLSGMIVGLAGSLYADLNRFVSPAMLGWHMSGEIMVFVILGGVGRLAGPILGAALFIVIEQALGGISDHWQAALGLILLAVVLILPGGLMGLVRGPRHG